MWSIKNNCENCEFRYEQFDIKGNVENMCILTNKNVGLIESCDKFKQKTGEHVTR